MTNDEMGQPRSEPTGSAFALWVGAACSLFGVLTLAGWYWRVRALESFGSGPLTMRPIAALAMTSAGVALFARSIGRARRTSFLLAGMTSALGLFALIDAARPSLRLSAHIVTGVLRISSARDLPPVAPATAVCLIFVGMAVLFTWSTPVPRRASVCALIFTFPAAVMLAGYIYDLRFTSAADLNRMTMATATALLVLGSAIWWLRGSESALRVMVSRGPGGSIARRLVPVGISVPLILGLPWVVALRHNLFGPVLSTAIGQVEAAVLFAVAVFWAAVAIEKSEGRRREAADQSERKGAQLEKAQRLAQIGSWERDLRSGRTEWSEELYRMFGYTPDGLTPSFDRFLDRVVPEDRARVRAEIERAAAEAGSFTIEYSITRPDGATRMLVGHGNVEKSGDGVLKLVGVAQDVTEQRRIEDALRESEDRYRIIVEGAAEGIWVSDAKGKMSLVNQRMAEMLGYSIEELKTMPLTTFLSHDGHRLLRRVRARRRAGHIDRYEVELLRKDGSTLWVNVAANPLLSPSGEFLGTLALISDISARKEAEAALQDAYDREREAVEQLRSVDDMKDAFLTAVSHELRTPLTGVLGFAATLQQRDEELSAEERAAITERLVRNAERLQHLLTDLLDLDRLKRGLLSPYRRLVNVDELVRGVAEHVDLALHPLSIDIVPGLDAFLDGPKVERIVENLLTNAVRHTRPESHIWVTAVPLDGGFVLSVDDDGAGIEEGSKALIFEPFQTANSTSYAPGTGIGLSLVAQFASLHAGRCWIEDRPGGGSSFKVFLPRGEADALHVSTGAA